jgi:hypothetical protein
MITKNRADTIILYVYEMVMDRRIVYIESFEWVPPLVVMTCVLFIYLFVYVLCAKCHVFIVVVL